MLAILSPKSVVETFHTAMDGTSRIPQNRIYFRRSVLDGNKNELTKNEWILILQTLRQLKLSSSVTIGQLNMNCKSFTALFHSHSIDCCYFYCFKQWQIIRRTFDCRDTLEKWLKPLALDFDSARWSVRIWKKIDQPSRCCFENGRFESTKMQKNENLWNKETTTEQTDNLYKHVCAGFAALSLSLSVPAMALTIRLKFGRFGYSPESRTRTKSMTPQRKHHKSA